MKTILKITLVCFAVLSINTISAQNVLEKKNVQKTEATSSVKSQDAAVHKSEAPNTTAASATARQIAAPHASEQAQPTSKQAEGVQSKTPAQMSAKPLKRAIIYDKKDSQTKEQR